MIRVRKLKCSLEGYMFALLAGLSFLPLCRRQQQYPGTKHLRLIAYIDYEYLLCCMLYAFSLQPVLRNQRIRCEYEWIKVQNRILILNHFYSKFHGCLWVVKKRFSATFWYLCIHVPPFAYLDISAYCLFWNNNWNQQTSTWVL